MRIPAFKLLTATVALLTIAATGAVPAPEAADPDFAPLVARDVRLQTIGYRLTSANAALCAAKAAATGLILHDIAQYAPGQRAAARRYFGFDTPIGVEGVVADSPAARAGVKAGDSIVAIDGADAARPAIADTAEATTVRALAVETLLDRAGADGAIGLTLRRGAVVRDVEVRPVSACRARFELAQDLGLGAQADGTIIQVGDRLMDAFRSDDEAGFIIGHELAHNMLRHRDRLDAAGVKRGMFEAFGRPVGYIRRTEVEADIVGIVAAYNAGFDPAAAAGFWAWFGPQHASSIFLARTHPKWSTRVKLLRREAAALADKPARPVRPPLLATADRPLGNDWQSLLAGL